MEKSKICQSCSMPLKRDDQRGTEEDGSISALYCNLCYVSGSFQNPEIDSAEKMQAFVKQRMKQMGFPGFLAGLFTKGIPRLQRWKN